MIISRGVKWVLGIAVAIVALPMAASALCGALLLGLSKDEVARVASPDGKLEAVLVETNGGATTSFGYEVHVVQRAGKPNGSPAAFMYGAVRNESAYSANLHWEKSNLLAVEFLDAKSSEASTPSVLVGGQEILLAMRSGISDSKAPPGGMLYNLKGRK